MNIKYRLIRSKRKTISVEITDDAEVLVRAPLRAGRADIERFLISHESWINSRVQMMHERARIKKENDIQPLTSDRIRELADEAALVIPERVRYYAEIMGVTYGRITIRHQKTRWGSCSAKGNLNFNCLLMMAPIEVLDYVVVHELAHRKQMNHSQAFWNEVAAVLPDYKNRKKWLKNNGWMLI